MKQFPENRKEPFSRVPVLMTNLTNCPRCGASHPAAISGGLCPHCLLAGLLDADREPRLGEREGDAVGPYELIEVLGEGGMGSVWRARQLHPVEREVALKIIRLGMDTRELVSRFESERQSLAMMDHPGIARVYEAGATAEGRPYFAMELVEGEPVTDYCVARGLKLEERLRLFMEICAAVAHAHRKGVIHRDLKPSNVMVVERAAGPQVKVIDFGIAKLLERENDGRTFATKAGHAVGTPGYMSPEQAGAKPDVDTRSDVYSLGALLYEMLTGTPPLGKETFREVAYAEVMRLIRETDPPRPSTRLGPVTAVATAPPLRIARDLDRIVMKALARERERRYGGAASLGDDVQRFLNHEPVTATDPTPAYRAAKFVRKHRLPVAFSAVLAVALIAATLLVAREAKRARAAGLETLSTLADSYRNTGITASQERDAALAALWFTRAAATAPHDDPRTRNNRLRAGLQTARSLPPVRKIERAKQIGCTLAFDADSRILHEGGFGLEHMFFDLESGAALDFGIPLRAACFLPGGKQVAVSDGGAEIQIRDLTTLATVERLENPDGKTTGIWCDDLGALLAFGDRKIHVWHSGIKSIVGAAREHALPVRLVRFAPGGERFLTIDQKSHLRVFDAAGDSEPLFPAMHLAGAATYDPLPPAFVHGPDRIRVRGNGGMRILDAVTGRVVERLPHLDRVIDLTENEGLFTFFNGVAETATGSQIFERPLGGPLFLPDEAAVYGAGSGEILDFRGQRLGKIHLPGYQRAISPDGTLLAVHHGDGITVYSLVQTEPFLRVIAPEAGKIALSADGHMFASGGWSGDHPTGTRTRAFHTADGQAAGPEIDTGFQNLCGIFSGAEGNLLTGGRADALEVPRAAEAPLAKGVFQLWNPATGTRLAGPLEIPAEPWAMCRHPREPWIAVLCGDGAILRLEPDLSGFAEITRLVITRHSEPGDLPRGQLVFSPDGNRLHANGFGSTIWTLDPTTGKVLPPPRRVMARPCGSPWLGICCSARPRAPRTNGASANPMAKCCRSPLIYAPTCPPAHEFPRMAIGFYFPVRDGSMSPIGGKTSASAAVPTGHRLAQPFRIRPRHLMDPHRRHFQNRHRVARALGSSHRHRTQPALAPARHRRRRLRHHTRWQPRHPLHPQRGLPHRPPRRDPRRRRPRRFPLPRRPAAPRRNPRRKTIRRCHPDPARHPRCMAAAVARLQFAPSRLHPPQAAARNPAPLAPQPRGMASEIQRPLRRLAPRAQRGAGGGVNAWMRFAEKTLPLLKHPPSDGKE